MLLSEKSKKHIDACRFCWMCRHICPIGNATGKECDTSRARALTLSLVTRGAAEMTPDIVANMYECALCGACTKECVTGWDPPSFTREVRREIALDGLLPDYISALLDNYEKTGNVYGKAPNTSDDVTADADTLFFLGADARCEEHADAVALLTRAGVSFTMKKDEPDSGLSLEFLIGEAEETKAAAVACATVLNAYRRVIVYDPADAKLFRRTYKEWGINLTCEIVTFTAFLADLLDKGAIKPVKSGDTVTYQDPPMLARELEETEEARRVISACATLREMLLNRRDTMLGGHKLMSTYMPAEMALVAAKRFTDAADIGVHTVVTADPSEYAVMSAAAAGTDMTVVRIETLLLNACQ